MGKYRNRIILIGAVLALLITTPTTLSAGSAQRYGVSPAGTGTGAADERVALTQSAKLVAGNVDAERFGMAVAVSADGSTAIVGAVGGNGHPKFTGAAYVFARVGALWVQQQMLLPDDSTYGDFFGLAVALSADGSTAVIGAPAILFYGASNPATNAAYVFTRTGTTWTQQQKLVGSDTIYGGFYGYTVALSADGGTAAVGALVNASGGGGAYIFMRGDDGWTQQQELTAADTTLDDSFGCAVALSGTGDTALVSACDKDQETGAAYIFTRSGAAWSQQQKLVASDAAAHDQFGYRVALSADGGTAVIGAPFHATNPGAAYVFTRGDNGWSQQAQLVSSDTKTASAFACSVAVSGMGDRVMIGDRTPTAYLFVGTGTAWSQQQQWTLKPPGSLCASEVAISADGTTVLVGAQNEDDGGAVYIFTP
jgi:hypothetical protein